VGATPPIINKIEKAYMGKTITKTRPVPKLDLKEPPMYRVIYINDEVTSMEFVIESLVTVFDHNMDTAAELTEKIHVEGSGTAAVLPYEMAEQKGVEVTQLARANGYPLVIKLEPEA
jgi:ATP-dependent Clp protease adaptor protein ClpS